MKRLRLWLTLAFVLTALALVALIGTNLIGSLVTGLYRNTTGLGPALTIGRVATGLAALGLLIAMGVIAAVAALTPGGWLSKALHVTPALLVLLALAAILTLATGIGTTGTIAVGPIALPLSGLLAIITGVCAIVIVSIAVAAIRLNGRILLAVSRVIGGTAVLAALAAVTIGVAAWMISTSQPSFGGGPAFERLPQGSAPGGGQVPGAQGTPGARNEPFGQARQAFPEGGFGRPGPGGGLGNLSRIFPIGAAAAVVLSFAGLGVGLIALRNTRQVEAEILAPTDTSARDVRGEIARAVAALCAVGAAVLVLIQFVPVTRTNPPVQMTIAWDSSETKSLFYQACADCHSNETRWPWYAFVAPASWLTTTDVNDARRHFNISEPSGGGSLGGGIADVNNVRQRIESGSMPPTDYLLMHPAARLTDAQKQQLIQGLANSLR